MNCQQLSEWEAKVARGRAIQAAIATIDREIALLDNGDFKIEVNLFVGPTIHSKCFLSMLADEEMKGDVVLSLVRILEDRRIALKKEFKDL